MKYIVTNINKRLHLLKQVYVLHLYIKNFWHKVAHWDISIAYQNFLSISKVSERRRLTFIHKIMLSKVGQLCQG